MKRTSYDCWHSKFLQSTPWSSGLQATERYQSAGRPTQLQLYKNKQKSDLCQVARFYNWRNLVVGRLLSPPTPKRSLQHHNPTTQEYGPQKTKNNYYCWYFGSLQSTPKNGLAKNSGEELAGANFC